MADIRHEYIFLGGRVRFALNFGPAPDKSGRIVFAKAPARYDSV
jgi:hypothetical protein